jgi:hypothetical protein
MKMTYKVLLVAVAVCCANSFAVNRWTKADGGWHQPATWGGATSVVIPKAGDLALVTNSVFVISDNWKELATLSIGKSGVSGSVLMESGGGLAPSADVKIGDGAAGSLILDGGYISVSNDCYAGFQNPSSIALTNGTLNVGGNCLVARGFSGNYAGANGSSLTVLGGSVGVKNLLGMGVNGQATGSITVSGGSLMVTNGLILDQGVFTVEGSSASITLAKNVALAQLDIRANATVKFVFDASGVSEIGFNNKTLELYEGASIEIDGDAFAGGAGTYRLLNAGAFAETGTNRFSNVTITGFDSFASATLEYDDAQGDVSLLLSNTVDVEIGDIDLAIDSGNAVVSWVGTNGVSYALQTRPSLTEGDWSNAVPGIAGADTTLYATNTVALPVSFYRIIVE